MMFVGVLQLDALGSATWGVAVPNVPEALYRNVFLQGLALLPPDLVLLAPAETRTQ